MLFPAPFTSFTHTPSLDITISGKQGGTGPPLLLLHGYPQTHAIWHLVAPVLASQYSVVLVDLRGYGASSKPPSSDSHAAYAKSAMAADCISVMKSLGHEKFFVCAHDRGARVAHSLCVGYPDAVKKAIFLDIVPTKTMYDQTSQEFATAYFHWFFLIQKAPFPEDMIGNAPEKWLQYVMKRHGAESVFHPEAYKEYENCMRDRECVRGGCEDYRAAATVDIEEQERDEVEGRRISCPLRVLWGKNGVVEKMFDGVGDWKKVHETAEVSGEAVDSGHYIPEEVPEVLLGHIKNFLV